MLQQANTSAMQRVGEKKRKFHGWYHKTKSNRTSADLMKHRRKNWLYPLGFCSVFYLKIISSSKENATLHFQFPCSSTKQIMTGLLKGSSHIRIRHWKPSRKMHPLQAAYMQICVKTCLHFSVLQIHDYMFHHKTTIPNPSKSVTRLPQLFCEIHFIRP